MKKSQYFVLYKSYTEYNQFEGCWDFSFEKCSSLTKANQFIKDIKRNGKRSGDLRFLFGPLKTVRLPKTTKSKKN